jgi:GT2 family glycosyltransferase
VARSVGHLVHILHGDDWVMPSFYDKVELAARRHPEIAFFSTRAYWVDEVGNIDTMNPRTPILERPGNDVSLFLNRNPFSFAAIVIRRRVFEATGGFLPELIHTADWEMWVRAIGNGGGYVINQPLACYRKFAANATNRLARSAENMRDFLRLCEIFTARYKGFDRREFLQMVFDVAAGQAQFFRQIQDIEAAVANENLCRELARPS